MNVVNFLLEKFSYRRLVRPNEDITCEKLAHRELVANGVVVLPEFFSKGDISNFKKSVPISLFTPTPEMQHRIDNPLADRFIPNADSINGLEPFFENEKLISLVRSYFSEDAVRLRSFVRIKEHTGPVSSFENFYHFDSIKSRLKVFLYLSDVSRLQAPVAYLKKSHKAKLWRFSQELDMFSMYEKDNKGYANDDLSAYIGCFFPHQVEKLKRRYSFDEVVCTGKAGTVIIFDAKGLHKATQLTSGKREILMSHWSIPGHHT